MQLNNRVVLLTGASRGIGRAAALALAEQGCRLALTSRQEADLQPLAQAIPNSLILPADLENQATAQYLVNRTLEHFQQLDILINNAAIGILGPSHRADPADIARVMTVNLHTPLALMQRTIPAMKAQGGGLIINILSIIGKRAVPGAGGYCASKAALEKMTESMRLELAADNIRFSNLYPGVTRTQFNRSALGETQPRRGRVTGVAPERVAAKVVQVARREPRDAYVTLLDRLFVGGALLGPGLMDRILARYF